MISLIEQPSLVWASRINYMSAKDQEKQLNLYVMDVLCLIARHYYDGITLASELIKEKPKQTTKQVTKHILERLGGE